MNRGYLGFQTGNEHIKVTSNSLENYSNIKRALRAKSRATTAGKKCVTSAAQISCCKRGKRDELQARQVMVMRDTSDVKGTYSKRWQKFRVASAEKYRQAD